MLLKMLVALAVAMTLAFLFRVELIRVVQAPLTSIQGEVGIQGLQSLGIADSMTISFKLAFYAGIVLSLPFLLFFLAQFVLPGLTAKEKKHLYPALAAGGGLFLAGVLFCYHLVLPTTLHWLLNDARSLGWSPQPTVRDYFSFVTQFVIGFGLTFELPVVVLFLVKIGLVDYTLLRKSRAYAVVLILVLAAVITPTTDLITLMLMAGPMLALFEITLVIAWWLERRERSQLAAHPDASPTETPIIGAPGDAPDESAPPRPREKTGDPS